MLSESVKFFSTHPVNGCRNETVHFILYVGKAKRCFGGGRFFFVFWKIVANVTGENGKKFWKLKKSTSSQTH